MINLVRDIPFLTSSTKQLSYSAIFYYAWFAKKYNGRTFL